MAQDNIIQLSFIAFWFIVGAGVTECQSDGFAIGSKLFRREE